MGKIRDISGQRFGRLHVVKMMGLNQHRRMLWLCECDCGNKNFIVTGGSLTGGSTKSCGCFKKEKQAESQMRHGMCGTKIYTTWKNMKSRCYNEKSSFYKDYGGRGIRICDEWLDKDNGFISFYNWSMEVGYDENLSIDRINVNGNYEPTNCRWATVDEQSNNKRNNVYLIIDGESKTVSQWAKDYNISRDAINRRIANGELLTKDILRPLDKSNKSGVIGVYCEKVSGKWLSKININYKVINLGSYIKKEDAIKARLSGELKYLGEFAPQKHLFEKYGVN